MAADTFLKLGRTAEAVSALHELARIQGQWADLAGRRRTLRRVLQLRPDDQDAQAALAECAPPGDLVELTELPTRDTVVDALVDDCPTIPRASTRSLGRGVSAAPVDATVVDSVEWLDEALLEEEPLPSVSIHLSLEELLPDAEPPTSPHLRPPREVSVRSGAERRRAPVEPLDPMDAKTLVHRVPARSAAGSAPPSAGGASPPRLSELLTDASANLRYGLEAKAEKLLRRAIQLEPESVEARDQLMHLYLRKGRTEEAGHELLVLADLYLESDLHKAEQCVLRAIELLPDHEGARLRADALWRMKRSTRADLR